MAFVSCHSIQDVSEQIHIYLQYRLSTSIIKRSNPIKGGSLLLNWDMVLRLGSPTFDKVSARVKTKREKIDFLSDVLVAIASLDLKFPNNNNQTRYTSIALTCTHVVVCCALQQYLK